MTAAQPAVHHSPLDSPLSVAVPTGLRRIQICFSRCSTFLGELRSRPNVLVNVGERSSPGLVSATIG